ncbi:MAG: hypothetical protein K8R58_03960 [Bacteroidales bacterium]|nr:hypothetical protein [Bacteroidales bacterium]
MIKKIYILLLFFNIIVINALSQNLVIYDQIMNESFNFNYQKNPDIRQITHNYFIKEIAKIELKNLDQVKFTYFYKIYKCIKEIPPGNFKAVIKINSDTCIGKIFYKGFNISDVLIPSKADFIVNILNNNNIFKSYKIKNLILKLKKTGAVKLKFNDTLTDKQYSLDIKDIRFYSDSSDKIAFNNRLMLINDYYASELLIDSTIQKI